MFDFIGVGKAMLIPADDTVVLCGFCRPPNYV